MRISTGVLDRIQRISDDAVSRHYRNINVSVIFIFLLSTQRLKITVSVISRLTVRGICNSTDEGWTRSWRIIYLAQSLCRHQNRTYISRRPVSLLPVIENLRPFRSYWEKAAIQFTDDPYSLPSLLVRYSKIVSMLQIGTSLNKDLYTSPSSWSCISQGSHLYHWAIQR